MAQRIITILICFLLSSCGVWHWVGQGKPNHALEKDIIHCKNKASQKFPTKTYFQRTVTQDVSATRDGAHGITIRPIDQIDIQALDANDQNRDVAFKNCMNELGWQLKY